MARPLKTGLDYFPFDVDFFDDDKISAVFVEFGVKGEITAIKLLCAIYREGYYAEWKDSLRIKLLKVLPGISEDLLEKIVNRLVKWEFFDKGLFDSARVLTSRGIQTRYFKSKRRAPTPDMPYILIHVAETGVFAAETPVIASKMNTCSERSEKSYCNDNPVIAAETGVFAAETPINVTESAIKESKDNNSLRSSLSDPSSSPPTPPPRVSDASLPVTAGIAVEQLKTDRDWLLQMQRRHGIMADSVVKWLESFVCDCDCRGKQQHENLADVKQHFNDWLAKQLIRKAAKPGKGASQRDGRQDGQPKQDYFHRWIQCQAELCRSVSVQESAATFEQMHFKSFAMQDGVPTLCVQIPSNEVYERLEKLHVSLMQRVITKYYGNFRLQYELPKHEN